MIYVAFFAGAIGAVGGAIAVIALRNPFYSVLALVVHLVSLAGLFLLLYAQFIAAAQVVVYAGAVMVLYVFVAAYVGAVEEPLWEPIPGQRFLAPLLAAALFVELSIAILGTGLSAIDSGGRRCPADSARRARSGTCCSSASWWSSRRHRCCSSSPPSARSRSPPGHESATSRDRARETPA